ncbi:MAG: histidine kinase [Bacteroidota bacterium]
MPIVEITKKRIARTYTIVWTIWITVQTFILTYIGLDFHQALIDSIVSNSLTAFLGIVLYNILQYYQPENDNFVYLRLWAFFLAVADIAIANEVLKHVFSYDTHYLFVLHQSLPIRLCFIFLMLGIITLLNWVRYYYLNVQETIERKADTEKMVREAELSKLRQQLQPHFLFNSLNSISALAGSKPEQARKMIQQLSDFLRGTLKKDDQQLVPLSDELQHLNLYLEIEKVRFGHRLNTEIYCDESLNALLLPSLLLQPIVENAIKFGLYDTTENVLIEIHTRQEKNELIVEVKNPYDSATAAPNKGTGFGLSSVQRRLYLLYARTDLLKTKAEEKHFSTTIHIPQP